ncbi:hypothetical protein Tco_0397509 [Tanacetum coccineum]|uniref:FBD domain-containing protein n=1 Tax=Tanacetum coccineum TaxID=301880 RepID=A0ABQ5HSD3_9ASTR
MLTLVELASTKRHVHILRNVVPIKVEMRFVYRHGAGAGAVESLVFLSKSNARTIILKFITSVETAWVERVLYYLLATTCHSIVFDELALHSIGDF